VQSLVVPSAGFQATNSLRVRPRLAYFVTRLAQVSVDSTYLHPAQSETCPGWIGEGVVTLPELVVVAVEVRREL